KSNSENAKGKEPKADDGAAKVDADGFAFGGVTVLDFSDGVKFVGEVTNNTGKDYQTTMFTLTIYDASGALVDTAGFVVNNFSNGRTKSFEALAPRVPPDKAKKYKIQFDQGI